MGKTLLRKVLRHIAESLAATGQRDAVKTSSLYTSLSRSLLPEDIELLKTSSFQLENSDLFEPGDESPAIAEALKRVGEESVAGKPAPEFRVAVREVAAITTLLSGSAPTWAGGAAVDHSIGPFAGKDGRQIWFDFFRIERLVALYSQGRTDPTLLFNVTLRIHTLDVLLPPITESVAAYTLPAGSIWINSQVLASSAPAGLFTGLTIRGGHVTLSSPPQLVGGKLTVAAGTLVTVRLDLQQPTPPSDASSPYGEDARVATVQLPDQLGFHLRGASTTFDTVSAAAWSLYGEEDRFEWQKKLPTYDANLQRVLIPFSCSSETFSIAEGLSPFFTPEGEATIASSAWAVPSGSIDILHPTTAAGIGGMLVRCKTGLSCTWSGLTGDALQLHSPALLLDPGHISLTDQKATGVVSRQRLRLWQDDQNPFGSDIQLQFAAEKPISFDSLAAGNEVLSVSCSADVQIDRPVTVASAALAIRSNNSALIIAATKALRLIYLHDENITLSGSDLYKNPASMKPIAIALQNALFKVTPVSGYILFGLLAEDFVKVTKASLFLNFGMLAYLPSFPDPYAANLGGLQFQFRQTRLTNSSVGRAWLVLICRVEWQPAAETGDKVAVSFHFAPLPSQQVAATGAILSPLGDALRAAATTQAPAQALSTKAFFRGGLPDYEKIWDEETGWLGQESFALLDVSTNADLLGVSFGTFGDRRLTMVETHKVAASADTPNGFPLQVQGMDVVTRGSNARVFTVPQISWEPVLNLTAPLIIPGDPPAGPNYYPDDGGPTRIINNSANQVALSPIPLTKFLVQGFDNEKQFAAIALFTLPFGIKSLALLEKEYEFNGAGRKGTNVLCEPKNFPDQVKGALHLELDAGAPLVEGESNMFVGSMVQINNILNLNGVATGASTLGARVTEIVNDEFLLEPLDLFKQRGVPLTRIDLSGYGANSFSNWLNPRASIAATSQARFDIWNGRCAHEVIQVKTILHPFGHQMVRTITLFRTGSGYAYRYDSGWVAETDGRFDFTYYVNVPGQPLPQQRHSPYEIHPGVIQGLFKTREIKETTAVLPYIGQMTVAKGQTYVDENGQEQTNAGADMVFPVELQPVFFNADVAVENPVSGFRTVTIDGQERKVVASKGILGFAQIKPRGMPISKEVLRDLVTRQGTIGGPLDSMLDLGKSGQQVRTRGFDFSNSFASDGVSPVFAAAPRGTTILSKDGAWSLVKHLNGTGEVTPVPEDLSIPVIRIGKVVRTGDVLSIDLAPATQLLRIAETTELLRPPVASTVNYGFLHATDTQKALFLTPAYAQGVGKMLSKTPPLFADAFRIVNSKAIFPNAGNAVSTFGDAINLGVKGTEFAQSALTDAGTKVREIMQIDNVVGGITQQGFQLLKKVTAFDLPNQAWTLVEVGSVFKIYIEYKADNVQKPNGSTKNLSGALDYDIDSFAANIEDTWKSHMDNVAMVVDLGPIKRLMTIKGNWDANKGAEAAYGGSATDPDFPSPQIEFSPELQPIIQILQILQDLQGENYKDAFQQGLKLAMSNKAGSWEYKMEASKEIPVVRFPPGFEYNDPNAPFKLEAGLKLGAYFNAALKVTTDPTQLLPTAGSYLGFYARLSVMCVSLSVATVYAVGQANLDIGADTALGPNLRMKFGFGAQLVVGLPVVGNVSVLYMVGVEIFIATNALSVSAFLLYQGHGELLAGLVAVTITIEAKGTVTRQNDRTDLAVQITFGLDISIFLVIDISFSTSWQEQRQIA